MKRRVNKILAIALAAVLILGMLPMSAFATSVELNPMESFIGEARLMNLGYAMANKVIEPVSGKSDEFDISLYVTGKNGVPKSYPIDVVFVIDTSGSMSDSDINAAKDAFRTAANTLFTGTSAATGLPQNVKDNSRVALVTYDQTAKIAEFKSGAGTVQWVTQSVWGAAKSALDSSVISNNSAVWTRNNSTATQLGIHAGHYLLNQASTASPYENNQKIMIVMTDGGPNRVYTGSSNTVSVSNIPSLTGSVNAMNPAKAPGSTNFSSTGTGDNNTASADGNSGSISRTLAQAKLARDAGIAVHAIGYNVKTKMNNTGSVAYKSLNFLGGSAGANFQHADGADIVGIFKKLTVSAAVRLQQLSVSDLIGAGFELTASPKVGDIRKADINNTKNFSALNWVKLDSANPDDNDDTIQLVDNKVIWNAGTVSDGILYCLKFTVKLTSTAANAISGTYYTNMNNGGADTHDFSMSENVNDKNNIGNFRGKQNGTHNKLTYMFDGQSNESSSFHVGEVGAGAKPAYLYACEKVVVKNTFDLTVSKAGTAKSAGDKFAFTVKLTSSKSADVTALKNMTYPVGVNKENKTSGVELTFKLEIGENMVLGNLPKGISYYVEETVSGDYITPSWNVNGSDLSGVSVSTSSTLNKDTIVICNNSAKVSDFTIDKSIVNSPANAAGWVAGEKIIFKVTVSRTSNSNVNVDITNINDVLTPAYNGTFKGPFVNQNDTSEGRWGTQSKPDSFTLTSSETSRTRYYTYIVGAADEGEYVNTATATANGADKSDTADFTVIRPTVTIEKSVFGYCKDDSCPICAADGFHADEAYVSNGSDDAEALFRITVTNTSDVPAQGLKITDANATWIPVAGESDPTTTAFSLGAGQFKEFLFKMDVSANIIDLPDFDYTQDQLDTIQAANDAKTAYDLAVADYDTAVNSYNEAVANWTADTTLTDALADADTAAGDYIAANGDLDTLKAAYEFAAEAFITQAQAVNEMDPASDDYVSEFDIAVELEGYMNDALALYNGLVALMNDAAAAQNAIVNAQATDATIAGLKADVETARAAMELAGEAADAAGALIVDIGIPANLVDDILAQMALVVDAENPNTATVSSSDASVIFDKDSDDATALVPPVTQSDLRSDKLVSVDGGATYGWFKVLDPENLPDEVLYKLSVINTGMTEITVALEDIFGTVPTDLTLLAEVAADSTITLAAGTSWTGEYGIPVSEYLNDSTENNKSSINTFTATLIAADGEPVDSQEPLTGSTIVITPARKYTDVTIGKWVLDGANGWQKSSVVTSNDPYEFIFKIELANYGTEKAIVALSDALAGNEFYIEETLETLFTDATIELDANGGSKTLYAAYTAASGESNTNVASYTLIDGGLKSIDSPTGGESKADISVIPELIPVPIFSVVKNVDSEGNRHIPTMVIDNGNATIQSDAKEFDVWFAVTVANKGTGAGSVILRDIFNGGATAETNVYDAAYPIDELAGKTKLDLTQPVELDAGDSITVYVLVKINVTKNPSTFVNVAEIFAPEDTDFENPIDSDDATVVVTDLDIVALALEKKVRVKGDDEWHDSVAELVANDVDELTVEYKLTVSVAGDYKNEVPHFSIRGQVQDLLEGVENLDVAGWTYYLHWGMDQDDRLSDEFIYEVTLDSSEATVYHNVVKFIVPAQQPGDVPNTVTVTYGAGDDATVTITKPGVPVDPPEYDPPEYDPPEYDPPEYDPPEPPTEDVLADDPVPLAPAEEEELPELEIPLAEAPETGDSNNFMAALVAAFLSVAGLVTLIGSTRKKEED